MFHDNISASFIDIEAVYAGNADEIAVKKLVSSTLVLGLLFLNAYANLTTASSEILTT